MTEHDPHDVLARALAPDLLDALEQLIDERVAAALDAHDGDEYQPRWLTCGEAAKLLGCSVDAVRMRVKRGRLVSRRQGRRVYISRDSIERL